MFLHRLYQLSVVIVTLPIPDAGSVPMTTESCRSGGATTLTRCSNDETSWPSAYSSALFCQRRQVFTICFRTSAIPLSRTDFLTQETLKL